MTGVCCLLFVVSACCLLSVVRCALCAVRYSLFLVHWLLALDRP